LLRVVEVAVEQLLVNNMLAVVAVRVDLELLLACP
jgi:hypothetical protein